MRRHLITLERETKNLRQAMEVCASLQGREEPLSALDAEAVLRRLSELEQEGTTFMDKQKNDFKPRRYAAAVAAAAVMALLMGGVIWLILWAMETDPQGAPPLPLLILLIAIPGAVILGVALALALRLREIRKGEEEDASQY